MQEIKKENLNYDKALWRKAFALQIESNYGAKNPPTIYLMLFIISISIAVPVLVNHFEKYNSVDITGSILTAASFILLYLHLTYKKRFVNKLVKNNFIDVTKTTYIVSQQGVTEITENERELFEWNLYKYYVMKDEILLLIAKDGGFRFFNMGFYSNEESQLLLKWLSAEVPLKPAISLNQNNITFPSENTFVKPTGKTSRWVIIFISVLFIGVIVATYIRITSNKFEGNWLNKTDSTSVLLVLNDNNTGRIELEAKNNKYEIDISNYYLQKNQNFNRLYFTYGDKKNYPDFFYKFARFDVANLTSDSLILVGNLEDRSATWWLRFEKQ